MEKSRSTISGVWYCKVQRARGESALGTALANTARLADSTASALVQLNGSTGSGVVVRAVGTTFYAARVQVSGRVELIRSTGGTITVLASTSATIGDTVSHRVQLSATGGTTVQLTVLLDGAKVLTFADASANRIPSGFSGLLNGDAARTQFDTFILSGTTAQ